MSDTPEPEPMIEDGGPATLDPKIIHTVGPEPDLPEPELPDDHPGPPEGVDEEPS